MTAKQNKGSYAPDGSKYATPSNGAGTLVATTTFTGSTKQNKGAQAPDGSIYMTLTNGSGTLL